MKKYASNIYIINNFIIYLNNYSYKYIYFTIYILENLPSQFNLSHRLLQNNRGVCFIKHIYDLPRNHEINAES